MRQRERLGKMLVYMASLLSVFLTASYVHAGDGNWKVPEFAKTGLYTFPVPAGTFSIKNGAQYTNKRLTTLHTALTFATSQGVSHVRFSNDGIFNQTTSVEAWRTFNETMSWYLPAANGLKTVYAQYKTSTDNSSVTQDSVFLDTVAPTAVSVSSPNFASNTSTTKNFRVDWGATDPLPSSGVQSYDVQYRNSTGASWNNWKTRTNARNATFLGVMGKTHYFRSRARDRAGNVSAWSTVDRTIVPYDEGVMMFTGGFVALVNSKYYAGSGRQMSNSGQYASYSLSNVKEVYLIAGKSPASGYADVFLNGVKIKTINLYSPTPGYRVAIPLKTSATPFSGNLKVQAKGTHPVGSSGNAVLVDGLAVGK